MLSAGKEYWYCIVNAFNPKGLFHVSQCIKSKDNSWEEEQMKRYGNHFETFEEAKKYADKVNLVVTRNGICGEDKNGNKVHILDRVKVPSGDVMYVKYMEDESNLLCVPDIKDVYMGKSGEKFFTKDIILYA